VAGFTIASVLCGLAGSLTEIVVARMLQGVFGAALVPLSQAVLLDINPREKHGSAMAVWGMGVMIGPILGPTLGGWLTDSYDWRWVFFINVPIGAVAFYGIWRYIRPVRRARKMRFRRLRLSHAQPGHRRAADAARPRRTERLVRLTETWIEVMLLALSFAYFVAHTALRPAGQSFSTTAC
jgi:DHA2 family multidrug resistance protein